MEPGGIVPKRRALLMSASASRGHSVVNAYGRLVPIAVIKWERPEAYAPGLLRS
jgi:hypothetical protein